MEDIKLINFTNLSVNEKIMILEWRNCPNIRQWMYNQNSISIEEHERFIENLKIINNKLYMLVKLNGKYIGVIDFTNITNESSHIGIYSNPNLKGNGTLLLNEIIKYGFTILNTQTLIAEVFKSNTKAYNLYKKHNFKEIGLKIICEKDVICMQLSKSES